MSTVEQPRAVLRSASDHRTDATSWVDDACAIDSRVLALASGPVLDIGCGPGRHVAELAGRGVAALGIDITPAALEAARARGAAVLELSVFDDVPGVGRWATALLLDGNIGIGGEPVRLLRRVRELLAPDGLAIVEVAPPGGCRPAELVTFEISGVDGPGFLLAHLGSDRLADVAGEAGFASIRTWRDGHRWFGALRG